MNNPILEDNLNCLPESIRRILPSIEPSSDLPQSVRIILGRQGWPVARVKLGDAFVHTNSLVDPWDEAKRWAETLDYKDVMVSFIYGCGFGYPLLEYAKRKKPYTETVIFERNVDLFYAMLSRIDMRSLLTDPSVHFVVGNMQQMREQLGEVLTADFLLRATKPASFFTWLAHRNEKAAYLEVHEWVWNNLELHLSGVGNSVHDTLVGMYNTLDNVEKIFSSVPLSSLRGAFAGRPAFIVANGPSLDKNIDTLAQAIGKSLILTAESALRPCLKKSICPDAVCVTERTPNVYHIHFEHEHLPPELVLVGLTLIDPRIPRRFSGPWVPVFRKGESTGKWIQESISDDLEGLNGGGSSAHLAFEFALWLGANPIIFVGQDLAFGPNKVTHSRLSAYSEAYLTEQVQLLQAQPTYSVPGIDGKPVATTKTWYEFKTWFEQQIRLHPETRFIDATEGGAYIQGTEVMTLQDAIAAFCHKPLPTCLYHYVTATTIPNTAPDETKHKALLHRIRQIRDQFNQLAQAADEDIRTCRMVEKACYLQEKYPGTVLPPFIETLFQRNTNAFRKYAVDECIVPFTQQVIFAVHKQINDIGEVDTVERLENVSRLQRQMFESLQKICRLVARHFELAEDRINARRTAIDL
ncbi:MAG: DUF115 domain-containing protein [Alicyclobacillus herbarius]|uniref:motility associated factor glycosyltransferase family protein n=1 Tax=Alicyclobacillus herbarius TaxID=122960 RepID=UPI002354E6AD|nr:6-hydroxymethylpterin diphosphokinase MptE-like protein [Alicyclobacillus herbarius]MCL6633467.1 DUF115 domain-containing protein [Alicyclobacillus herbarius]